MHEIGITIEKSAFCLENVFAAHKVARGTLLIKSIKECDNHRFFEKNKPSKKKHTEFTDNKYWLGGNTDSLFWWEVMREAPETRQIRIDFVSKLINIVQKKLDL